MEKNEKTIEAAEPGNNEKLMAFFGTAVHDVKAPFRNIGSYLEIIKSKIKDCADNEELTPFFDRIDTARNKITVLLDELMKFIRTSQAPAKKENVNLRELFKKLSAVYQNGNTDIKIQGDIPNVKGDAAMLNDLFQSLISNAIKFKNGEKASIEISAVKKDGFLEVQVRDHGIGIEEKYLEKIFEPFERLNSPEDYPGAGLGLSICRSIVQKHGGKISVQSEYEKGSTFSVMLPLN